MLTNVVKEPDIAVYPHVGGNRILRSFRNSLPDDTLSKSENKSKFLTTRVHSIHRTQI